MKLIKKNAGKTEMENLLLQNENYIALKIITEKNKCEFISFLKPYTFEEKKVCWTRPDEIIWEYDNKYDDCFYNVYFLDNKIDIEKFEINIPEIQSELIKLSIFYKKQTA